MIFELLPNEILLYLFEFLPINHLIHAFHGLNSRFDFLLFRYFAEYGIDFRPMYSNDAVNICREYLPTSIDKLSSLYLSENDYLCRLGAYSFTIGQFVQLKSLSLSYLSIEQVMGKIMLALPHLINLTHLTLKSCRLPRGEWEGRSNALPFINCIWSLPKLTHCCIDDTGAHVPDYGNFIETTVVSSSITHLFILGPANYSLNLA